MSWKPFSPEEESKLVKAIAEAENGTSGEIRVHVDRYCKTDPLLKAKNLFVHLGMDKTELSNGVIFYISIEDKKFAIYGDKGINEKVEPDFWDSTAHTMEHFFKQGLLVEGISSGLSEAGNRLKTYFPRLDNDKNELPDEISYS